jgi:hypothetical protein
MPTNLSTAELGAIRRCDGMGEPAEDGDYVLMAFEEKRQKPVLFKISIGQAGLLIDELLGCLSAAGHTREVAAHFASLERGETP